MQVSYIHTYIYTHTYIYYMYSTLKGHAGVVRRMRQSSWFRIARGPPLRDTSVRLDHTRTVIFKQVCVYVCVCVYIYIYIYIYTRIYIKLRDTSVRLDHTRTVIFKNRYVCVCICIYTHPYIYQAS